ncbi:hypothetical protein N8E89_18845 (plasmid) [Phyllobacterium sp. A18/5-2]|uniref:hypothetical protein n=1 Tax=Phyllobacterium sp. A18/5-2 TaxID=2978392 RepID=UPI0021C89741|nr:hypothetical protein [Phyllobacterium sp. A18/5-2]UXN66684.1 hypothetical protein N8E89_18845 [Phyllobacterium sp. A18/5-2]
MDVEAEQKRPDVLAESILRAAGMSVDDLKSFETVFRELAASFATRMAAQTDVAVGAEFVRIESLEKDDIADTLSRCGLVGMVPVAKWGSRLLLAADRSFVDCGIEALFGSGASLETGSAARALTTVDLGIARQVFGDVTASLDHMFSGGAESLFQIGDLVEAAHLAPGTVSETRMICCAIALKAADRSGQILILLPRSSFKPMQDAMARMLRQPAHHSDPAWAKKLRLEVSRARDRGRGLFAAGVHDPRTDCSPQTRTGLAFT